MQYNGGVSFQSIINQTVPTEGPKAIPLLLDFTSIDEWDLDLTLQQQQGYISMIQTVYVDASDLTDDMTITFNTTNQTVTAKVGTQGYYSVLCPNPPVMKFTTSATGAGRCAVWLINVPIPGVVWTA